MKKIKYFPIFLEELSEELLTTDWLSNKIFLQLVNQTFYFWSKDQWLRNTVRMSVSKKNIFTTCKQLFNCKNYIFFLLPELRWRVPRALRQLHPFASDVSEFSWTEKSLFSNENKNSNLLVKRSTRITQKCYL